MASIYRIERTLPTGWRVRLECVPYDATLQDSRTNIDGVALLELGPTNVEYDQQPFGLQGAGTQSFRLLWNALPAALKTYLKNGYDVSTGNRNIWMLFTDRGTSGATWTLEFAGTEDNVESLELEPLGNAQFAYSVELVDLVYYACKTLTAAEVWNAPTVGPLSANGAFSLSQRFDATPGFSGQNQRFQLRDYGFTGVMVDLDWIMTEFGAQTELAYWPKLVRSSAAASLNTSGLQSIDFAALSLYAVNALNTGILPQVARTTPVTEAYVVAEILQDGNVVGGIRSPLDEYSLTVETESAYDVFRQLCEQFGVKLSYQISYVSTPGSENLTVEWRPLRVLQGVGKSSTDDTSNVSLNLDDAISTTSLVIRGENVLKAEARWQSSVQSDTTELVTLADTNRGARSFNTEFRVQSQTIFVDDPRRVAAGEYERKAPLTVTNLIWLKGSEQYPGAGVVGASDFWIAPHGKTRYWYGPAASDYVELDGTTGLDWLVNIGGTGTSLEAANAYLTWLQSWQTNGGMPATWTKFCVHVFGNENNARMSATWPLGGSTFVLPDGLGSRHTLTGAITTEFDQVTWTQAIATGISTDWNAGTSEVTYQIIRA
jgi:hypothetical protein